MLRVIMENFKGAKNLEIELGKTTVISGGNGKGKTRVLDAVLWCLTGKDHKGRADYEIKTRRGGEVEHGLDPVVELFFNNLALKRSYSEDWKRKRGDTEATLSGHKTTFSVDSGDGYNELKKRDFETVVKSHFGTEEEIYTILDPWFFSDKLHWEKRRKIVMDGVSVLNDDIARQTGVSMELVGTDASETRKAKKHSLKGVNDALGELKTRISEAKRTVLKKAEMKELQGKQTELETMKKAESEALSALPKNALDSIYAEIEKKREEIALVQKRDSNAGRLQAEYQRYVQDKRNESSNAIQTVLDANALRTRDWKSAVANAEEANRERERAIKAIEAETASLQTALASIANEYRVLDAKKYDELDTCPACGQKLQAEKIDEAVARFNSAKAEDLREIAQRGKEAKAKLEEIKNAKIQPPVEIPKEPTLDALPDAYDSTKDPVALEMLAKVEEAKKAESASVEEIEKKVAVINVEIDTLKRKIAELGVEQAEKESPHKKRIADIESELVDIRAQIAQSTNASARVAELKGEQKKLAKQFTRIKDEIKQLDHFIVAKVTATESEIEAIFGVHFRMFTFNLGDGELKETCDVLCNTGADYVPFPAANRALQITTGAHLCGVLQKKTGRKLPIIVDNAESVTAQIKTDAQLIELRVEKGVENLHIAIN